MDLKPTEQMAKNAQRGLELRKEFNRGGTEVGVARATQLKNRENLSPETIKRMTSYFARHAGDNLSETDPPSAGYIAWLLWGGDAGRDWAERKAKQIDEQKENEMKAIEQKKNENKENGPIKTKYRFSHRGLDCYILTSGWVEKRGQTEMTVDKTHVGVCEDLDFETPKLKSFAEAKKQVIKHIDEGKKDIGMNSLSKKKLAVIKSNAAPEVKLKALEKLNQDDPELAKYKAALKKKADIGSDLLKKILKGVESHIQFTKTRSQDSSSTQELKDLLNKMEKLNIKLGSILIPS